MNEERQGQSLRERESAIPASSGQAGPGSARYGSARGVRGVGEGEGVVRGDGDGQMVTLIGALSCGVYRGTECGSQIDRGRASEDELRRLPNVR